MQHVHKKPRIIASRDVCFSLLLDITFEPHLRFINMLRIIVSVIVTTLCVVNAFRGSIRNLHKASTQDRAMSTNDEDPNYKAHLPSLLKKGLSPDRPDPEIAGQLRARYKEIIGVKKDAAVNTLKTANPELAAELEELADEMEETHEHFVALAESWDAWGRPDPDLPLNLGRKKYLKKIRITRSILMSS